MRGTIIGDIMSNTHSNCGDENSGCINDMVFTGVTVLTLGTAEAILNYFHYDAGSEDLSGEEDESNLKYRFAVGLMKWSFFNPHADYSEHFLGWRKWDASEHNKWTGTEAAAIIAPIAWLLDDISIVRKAAVLCASTAFDHSDWIREAEAIASATYLARHGLLKPEIKEFLKNEFDLAQGSAQNALLAFFDGKGFTDVILKAISYGDGNNAIAAMAGTLAEAYYGVDHDANIMVADNLTDPQISLLNRFDDLKYERTNACDHEPVRISRSRVTLLPEHDLQIASHYQNYRNFSKAMDDFQVDEETVSRILRLAEVYTDRKQKENADEADFIADYINELKPNAFICGETENPIKAKRLYGLKDEEIMVLDMLRFSNKDLTVQDICDMTGMRYERVQRALKRIKK